MPTTSVTTPPTTESKPITIEDVHKVLGAMYLEIELLRRENASLKRRLNGDE